MNKVLEIKFAGKNTELNNIISLIDHHAVRENEMKKRHKGTKSEKKFSLRREQLYQNLFE